MQSVCDEDEGGGRADLFKLHM